MGTRPCRWWGRWSREAAQPVAVRMSTVTTPTMASVCGKFHHGGCPPTTKRGRLSRRLCISVHAKPCKRLASAILAKVTGIDDCHCPGQRRKMAESSGTTKGLSSVQLGARLQRAHFRAFLGDFRPNLLGDREKSRDHARVELLSGLLRDLGPCRGKGERAAIGSI